MNKTPRLGKSGIEYLDYVWNFYSGCLHKKMGICSVDKCWARVITERFPGHYPNGFKPMFYPEAFVSPVHLKTPSIIGCAFMGDLFGDWVDPDKRLHAMMPSGKASITMSLKGWIFTTIRQCPQHQFLFLTKCPQNLSKWGEFPPNCWVGVTATDWDSFYRGAVYYLPKIQAKVKFVSFEPLLGWSKHIPGWITACLIDAGIQWVILGSQTKPYKPPKMIWIDEIVRACDNASIPVFLKNNLMPLMEHVFGRENYLSPILTPDGDLRQEMPTTNV